MLIKLRFRFPEVLLGILLAVAIFAMGMLFASSPSFQQYSQPEKSSDGQHPKEKSIKIGESESSDDKIARYTLWLAILTGGLVVTAIGQGYFLLRSAKLAERALTDIERAFVSIDGFNFELTTMEDMKETEILEGEPEWHRKHPGLVIRRFALQPRWKNSGNTPTKNMTIQVD
jgi:hypothetical protein